MLDLRACIQVSDDGVQQLKDLTAFVVSIQEINRITSACLEHLQGMKTLREIGLDDTGLLTKEWKKSPRLLIRWRSFSRTQCRYHDAAFEHFGKLKKLTTFQARGITTNGSGLVHLSNLPALKTVELAETQN